MTKPIRSLLSELSSYNSNVDKYTLIESKATHFINSGINLLEEIDRTFNENEADELRRRLFNSLKGKDERKFSRKIRELKENSS
mgnify:CR=1 FL=1